jgi:hypothetical protein
MSHRFSTRQLNPSTVRIAAQEANFADLFESWVANPGSCTAFSAALADMPWPAFRWELPALDRTGMDQPFECVVVDSPEIALPADPRPFREHLAAAGERLVIRFKNLGGDAELIVPCPVTNVAHYSHLGTFVRGAPGGQQVALWQCVGQAMLGRVGNQPLWLNTAGGAVAWLHVRIDQRPKYYVHAPYRLAPR